MPQRRVREEFVLLPVTPLVELTLELGEDWDGRPRISGDVRGAAVKLVLCVNERWVPELDLEAFRAAVLKAGAVTCRDPVVHAVHRREARDARHVAELTLEESLTIFAEEVRAPDLLARVTFAAELAREADNGVTE